ncbi:PREDICTED: uncharacterized protein LOC18593823 [Theobroma cacao]|uniref:DUF4408 domain-containing protein n=2 Tax=Theobroma cacao TaxID=3641 RepID=A0A061F623_THECC|nr:PREDICTED: uncharacterized protein LOC18593823 [Theobroma cacao]EOY12795.1 Uncharacterized protein TCM_031316 [Theobroma cacao]
MAKPMLSLKTALISTGIISIAIFFKVSLPLVSELLTSGIPSTYSLVLSFLRPPYLYLLINCIIISIVASSKLQHKAETQQSPSPEIVLPAVKVSSEVYSSEYSYGSDTSARVVVAEDLSTVEESKEAVVVDGGDEEEEQVKVVMSLPPPPPARSESMELVMSLLNEKAGEKPPVSKRFGQRKAVKAASEGKALRVSKPKRHDTLESTWKTITEGRPMPLTRHLKKSDTWEQRAQKDPNAPPPPLPHTVKKSDTFNERPNGTSLTRSSGSGKLKKDPSLSQDDLNRRVEAFIKKFNEEMRLQRQESWNQYQEMIRRGAE